MSVRAKPAPMAGLVRPKAKDAAAAPPPAAPPAPAPPRPVVAGGPPTLPVAPVPAHDPADPPVALNFTVPRSFRRRFKRLALDLDTSQVELLRRAVALLERELARRG